MSDSHIAVSSWDDIDAAPEASSRVKQRVATIFTEQSWDHVVWLPSWLLEDSDKDIETVDASDHLAVGDVEDYSDKAWKFEQPHRNGLGGYLPKSSVVVFERVRGVEEIATPQTGLAAFARGDDA
ncbi:hypothetical protein SG26_20515 (plasmid) [Haloarcula sp. CBA1115]|uniref:hypothetical protein n=1 Tax=unclassified Haloarcula TaxID=2624677 RepID=UPI000595518C|nr:MULTISPECIES: hypothetical protein [unclassified Haloarcula]AJF28133.1 hypothetical protein SG26_20515 [Haloarcula sp. CBA1115]